MTTTRQTAQAARLDTLRARVGEHDPRIDGILITNQYSRRYLSGFTGSNGVLLIARDEARIATDFRYWEQAEAQTPGYELLKCVGPLNDWFGNLARTFGARRLGFEAADVSVDLFRQMRELIGELPAADRPELVPTTGIVEGMREIKGPEEIEALERAVALGDAAFAAVAERIEPGWTERHVAWEIEGEIRARGGDGTSFSTIVAGGPWGAMPHARPRDEPLRAGEPIVIDMGALLDGYCSDMTRTIVLGAPDARFKQVYDIVLAAQLAAEGMIEAGMEGEAAHLLAHHVIEEAGYGEEFGHGLGHGIGLQVHEAPRVAKRSTDTLRDGMVFSIEPGIYIPGWGGVRIEDLVVLEHGRCRVLTQAPKLRFAGG